MSYFLLYRYLTKHAYHIFGLTQYRHMPLGSARSGVGRGALGAVGAAKEEVYFRQQTARLLEKLYRKKEKRLSIQEQQEIKEDDGKKKGFLNVWTYVIARLFNK